jgi:hypothetical protein
MARWSDVLPQDHGKLAVFHHKRKRCHAAAALLFYAQFRADN